MPYPLSCSAIYLRNLFKSHWVSVKPISLTQNFFFSNGKTRQNLIKALHRLLPLDQQIPWLDTLTAGLARMRGDGRPARGLCWYSRGDQFDWQTALIEPVGAVTEVGLFDNDRRARPVAARFADHAASATLLGSDPI